MVKNFSSIAPILTKLSHCAMSFFSVSNENSSLDVDIESESDTHAHLKKVHFDGIEMEKKILLVFFLHQILLFSFF